MYFEKTAFELSEVQKNMIKLKSLEMWVQNYITFFFELKCLKGTLGNLL